MRLVSALQFLDDGSVVVNFTDPATDVRNEELLAMHHQIVIQPGRGSRDYLDEIEDVRDAAKRLLDDALEDWDATTPVGKEVPE